MTAPEQRCEAARCRPWPSAVAVRLLTGMVRGYQLIVSPWFAPTCRYYPSCSSYAVDAFRLRGPVIGTGLAVWRVMRCNPWSRGGVDPVRPAHDLHHSDTAPPSGSRATGSGEQSAPPSPRTLSTRTSRPT